MKSTIRFTIIILATFLISCSSQYYFQISTLKPARVPISNTIQKVVIINNCYNKNHCSITDIDGKTDYSFDSIFTLNHVLALNDVLANSPRFQVLKVYNVSSSNGRNLSSTIADSICRQNGADAAIIFEKSSIAKVVYCDSKPLTDSIIKSMSSSNEYKHKFRLALINYSGWNFYSSIEHKIVDSEVIKDSTNVFCNAYNFETSFENTPSVFDELYSSATRVGTQYGRKISQEWTNESRFIYRIPGYDFDAATKNIEKNKWDDAIELWKKNISVKDKSKAAKAAYNIAVACEVKDEIYDALEWASKSYFLQKNDLTEKYIKQLEKRLKNKYVIVNQLKV